MRKIALFLCLILFGCAPAKPAASTLQPPALTSIPHASATFPVSATVIPVTPQPTAFDPSLNPLTGLPPDDPDLMQRRPVMVKVSNYPRTGRPHAGLSSADIVFEYYIGEMFNRFLAVFYGSDSSQVGPIRSGRLVDAELANQFHGILVYGNADDRVDEILSEKLGDRAVPTKFGRCPPICGTDTHSVVGVFVDTGMLSESMREGDDFQPAEITPLVFQEEPPAGGVPAESVAVQYAKINRGEWHYDAGSGKYLRWIEETDADDNLYMAPLVDRNNGEQLAFSNVVILSTFYIEYNRTLHNIDLLNNAKGQQALLFRDGHLYQGLWRSAGADRPFELLDSFGKPLPLKPGKTWVVLAGISSTFKQPQPGEWELLFYLP